MSERLEGSVRLSKRLRQNSIWQRKDYGWAWVDLLLLANDRPRTVFLGGMQVNLRRGQLAWSIRGLAKEWEVSREWVESFLQFCQEQIMLKVDSNTKRTVITILNYEAYNRPIYATDPATEPATDPATNPATDPATEPATEPQWNKEGGIRNGKGEEATTDFVVIPSDSEVEAFCAAFQDLARGITGIPEVWWRGWLSHQLSRPVFPVQWQASLRNAFLGDWVARHPKALGEGRNGEANDSGHKGVSVWEVRQRLEALKNRAVNHEANDASAAWCGEPTEEQWKDFEKVKAEIRECEGQLMEGAA